jgi:predicted metal-binding membrane protein
MGTAFRPNFTAALVAAICGAAWLALWLGQGLHSLALGAGLLAALPGFVLGWTLMTAAMMLPTSLPLIALFARLTRRRPERHTLLPLLLLGYVLVWLLAGLLAFVAARALAGLLALSPWLAANAWLPGAGLLALAGFYQFTPLKYRCLDACRSPLHFISARWSGQRPRLRALRIGLDHGLFCVGCCWSLMLLMFALGSHQFWWMLVLGSAMAAEKVLPQGRRLGRPLGALLLASALLVALLGLRPQAIGGPALESAGRWICGL